MTLQVLLGLGSNIGSRTLRINCCIEEIRKLYSVVAISNLYETPPFGNVATNLFLNCAVSIEVETRKNLPSSPVNQNSLNSYLLEDLLALRCSLERIELKLGRTPEYSRQKWGDREIDIDILVCQPPVKLESKRLCIPHPHFLSRDFALIPAAEIAGNWVHPDSQRTLRDEMEERFKGRILKQVSFLTKNTK